mgnify:FL=1
MQWFVFNLFVLSSLFVPTYSFNIKAPIINPCYSRSSTLNMNILIPPDKDLGKFIVKQTSSLLPHVDTIGHKVLHANNEFITYILNLHSLSDNVKKDIVLFSIRLAQYGDDAGSHMLQFYYDLVDKCL